MPATAPTYNMYSNLVDTSTTQQFMEGVFEEVKKHNTILSLLDQHGNVKMDASGKFFERNLWIGQHSIGYRSADLGARSFTRNNPYISMAVPFSVMETTGVLGELDVMFNRGKEALIPLTKRMWQNMYKSFRIDIASKLLATNASANTVAGVTASAGAPVPVFGLPTVFGYGSSALAYDPDTQTVGTAVAAGNKEVAANSTYCGVSTHPTNAIAGIDNKLNESTSPTIINWSSTGFSSTTTWAGNCIRALNHACDRTTRSESPEDMADIGLMTRSMFTDFKNALVQYYKIELSSAAGAVNAGQYRDNKIPFNNIDIRWDAAMPANVFYVLNSKKMEFVCFPQQRLLQDNTLDDVNVDKMFTVRSQYDINQGGHLAVAQLAGQLWLDPQYHAMGYQFA